MNAMKRTWKVHGYDTFAREDYFLAEFTCAEEAEAFAARQREELAATQPAELRDRIWIEPPPTNPKEPSESESA